MKIKSHYIFPGSQQLPFASLCAGFGVTRTCTAAGAIPVTGSIIASGPSESVSCLLMGGWERWRGWISTLLIQVPWFCSWVMWLRAQLYLVTMTSSKFVYKYRSEIGDTEIFILASTMLFLYILLLRVARRKDNVPFYLGLEHAFYLELCQKCQKVFKHLSSLMTVTIVSNFFSFLFRQIKSKPKPFHTALIK